MTNILPQFGLAYVRATRGPVDRLAAIESSEVVTAIHFAPPIAPDEIYEGIFSTSVRDLAVDVHIRCVREPSQDPFRKLLGRVTIGPVLPAKPPLSFEQFADHQGKVPFVLVSVVSPSRVADWLQHRSNPDRDYYDDAQVTG